MRYKIRKKFKSRFRMTSTQKIYMLLIAALYFGVALGSLFVGTSEKIENILIGYAQSIHLSIAPATILLNDLIIYFLFFSSLFLLGMSVYGYIFIPIIPFIKGFSYGFTSAFYFKVFGAKGILMCAMGVLPQDVIICICLILGAHFAFLKSLSFKQREFSRSFPQNDMRQYTLSFFALFGVAYLTVLMDIFLTGNVIKIFC